MPRQPIGKIAALESNPTTITHFTFWTKPELRLSPFDIVKVEHVGGSFTFGQVEEISHATDAASFLSSFISNDFGDALLEPPTERVGMNYVKAKVLWNSKGVFLPVHDGKPVFLASEDEIATALGFDKVRNQVVCGFAEMYSDIEEEKTSIPVPLDRDFLIGPEGAHLNISGISGLAAKTSYATFLVKSLTEALAKAKPEEEAGTAAFILLNVKGKDLLALDEMTSDADVGKTKDAYEKLGLSPKPLSNVHYFYPAAATRGGIGVSRPSTFLPEAKVQEQMERGTAKIFKFTAKDDLRSIDLLFSDVDDPQQTIAAIVDAILVEREKEENGRQPYLETSDWAALRESVKARTEAGARGGDNSIPVMSWRRFYRFLTLQLDRSGVFASAVKPGQNECRLANEILEIKPNDVFVVDVARETESTQAFVFGTVMREVLKLQNGEYDGQRQSDERRPDRIVIIVDEMNKYCSKDAAKNSPILAQVLEITERGRSLGVVLFGAEQFRSAIHERVTGNCATKAYGRTNSVELAKKDYGSLNAIQKDILMRLDPGEYIVEHPVLRAPIRIRFPKPIYRQYK
jgi:hypothetical protein